MARSDVPTGRRINGPEIFTALQAAVRPRLPGRPPTGEPPFEA